MLAIIALFSQVQPVAADAGDVIAALLGSCKCCENSSSSSFCVFICIFLHNASLSLIITTAYFLSLSVMGIIAICAFIGWYHRRNGVEASDS